MLIYSRIWLAAGLAPLAASLLLSSLPAAVLAQDGPSVTMSDEAEGNATADAPDTLNTAQQARMRVSAAKRNIDKAGKYEKKSAEATDSGKKADLHKKAEAAFSTAIGDYQAALKLDPKLVEAYVGLANLMIKAGRHEQAIQTFDLALALEPASAEALAGKGRAQLAAFKVSDAQATYDLLATTDVQAARSYLAEMRSWLDAQRARLGPEMAGAIDALDSWIKERETK